MEKRIVNDSTGNEADTTKEKALNYDKDLIYLFNHSLQVKRAIQEIQGIAGMIIYDGEISEEEVATTQNFCAD